MSIEITKDRMYALAIYEGTITVESANGYDNELVIRIPYGDGRKARELAESTYNNLCLL